MAAAGAGQDAPISRGTSLSKEWPAKLPAEEMKGEGMLTDRHGRREGRVFQLAESARFAIIAGAPLSPTNKCMNDSGSVRMHECA